VSCRRTDGRTGMTKLVIAFFNIVKALKFASLYTFELLNRKEQRVFASETSQRHLTLTCAEALIFATEKH
jgi:hypothetical protein